MQERTKISVYLDENEKEWLKKQAEQAHRSMSNQARAILLKDYNNKNEISKKYEIHEKNYLSVLIDKNTLLVSFFKNSDLLDNTLLQRLAFTYNCQTLIADRFNSKHPQRFCVYDVDPKSKQLTLTDKKVSDHVINIANKIALNYHFFA